MKLAGCLALALSIILGAWSIRDYRRNEQRMDFIVKEMNSGIHLSHELEVAVNDERYDGDVAILAALTLIGSVILFDQAKRRPLISN